MRVLILSLHFAPDTVSNAVVVTDVARELAARGHTVTVVSSMPYHQAHRIEAGYRGRLWKVGYHDQIRVVRTWLLLRGGKRDVGRRFLAYTTFNLTSTVAALFTGKHDVVITPSPPLTIGVSGWLVARMSGAKFIYNVQDIYPDAAAKLGLLRSSWSLRFFRWLEHYVYARADAVSVISDDFRDNLLDKDVPSSKIKVIANPVDVDFIRPLPRSNAFAEEHNLVGKFVALYAGNIGLAQGLETLIEAARLTTNPVVQFVIVGNGAGLEATRCRAAELNLSNVRFLPFQPRQRVPELYASADIGIVLLRRGMGKSSTPSKVYSIMASGRPVLAAVDPCTEVWRLVERIGCGTCVPPEDPEALACALDRLSVEPSNTAALGERGRRYVENRHSLRTIGDQYDALMGALARTRET